MTKPTCSVEDCPYPVETVEWCAHHYELKRNYGDPLATPRRQRRSKHVDPETWFWMGVDRSGGPDACWPWTRGIGSHGYGMSEKRDGVRPLAHRQAWAYANGMPFPSGPNGETLEACHSCHNRPCCNPAHISPGTHQENSDQMWEAGRQQVYRHATHCNQGHEFTPENTYIPADGRRRCRICRNETTKRSQRRAREARYRPSGGDGE